MGGNTSIPCGFSLNNIPNPGDGMVVLQFSPNLVPQLEYTKAWMKRIIVYCLHFRLVRPYSCTHKIRGVGGNTSMVCFAWYNNIHQPEDSMVVLQFSPNLVPQLDYSVAWTNGIPVYWYIIVLEQPCGAYTKCVAIPESNVWTHMTLITMHLPPDYGPGYAKIWYIRSVGTFI